MRQHCVYFLVLGYAYSFILKKKHKTPTSVSATPLRISPTGQSPTIGSDASPDNRVGICVSAFTLYPCHENLVVNLKFPNQTVWSGIMPNNPALRHDTYTD